MRGLERFWRHKMKFDLLDPSLEDTANSAVRLFKSERAVKSIKTKEHPFGEDGWAPTFFGVNDERICVCVEVSDNPYPTTLDAFILDCKNRGFPAKCYVVMPKDSNHSEFKVRLKRAQANGVGVLEIDKHLRPHSYCEATTLSLTGLRNDVHSFPKSVRPRIVGAMSTFCNGNPAKGCSEVYDEIELLTRQLGGYASTNGWWKAGTSAIPNFVTDNWNPVLNFYLQHLDFQSKVKPVCPLLDKPLLQRIIGVTTYRNQTGHKPKNIQKTMDRDRRLKTRFEAAVDLFLEVIEAIKPSGIV
jgi:hypothetical protein